MANQHTRLAMSEDIEDEDFDTGSYYSTQKRFNDCFDGLIVEKWDLGPFHDVLRNKVLQRLVKDSDIDTCHELLKILQKNSKIGLVRIDNNIIGITGLNTTKMWWSIIWRSRVVEICSIAVTAMMAYEVFI